jgi:hypothetical protein
MDATDRDDREEEQEDAKRLLAFEEAAVPGTN